MTGPKQRSFGQASGLIGHGQLLTLMTGSLLASHQKLAFAQ
jgi:hypothetical protein